MTNAKKICAIYTRKSTDERLDMTFNTLDAQREACEAYILSQKSEGWSPSKVHYDDGGYSGGSLERPALDQLIEDIKTYRVNIVVVYKIDRLTRSLADFSKLVEVFDEYGVTFVSVTQSFNTTTSMGRLTLNVLLSFAQFEREVTGERIRDKIAASKAKGMWMGGSAPLGYSIDNRQLAINKDEAPIAKLIFERYLEYGSVKELKTSLEQDNIKSPARVSKKGRTHGNKPYSRGSLYKILKNRAYIGKITHKDKIYEGLHKAIIDQNIWDQTQKSLSDNTTTRKQTTQSKYMLQGLLFDPDGTPYSPTYTAKKTKNGKNKQYRYYISQNLLQYKDHPKGLIARIPAKQIEGFVGAKVRTNIDSLYETQDIETTRYISQKLKVLELRQLIALCVDKVVIENKEIELTLSGQRLTEFIKDQYMCDAHASEIKVKTYKYIAGRKSKGAIVINSMDTATITKQSDEDLQSIVQGIVWRDLHFDGYSLKEIAFEYRVSDNHVGQMIFKSLEPKNYNSQ